MRLESYTNVWVEKTKGAFHLTTQVNTNIALSFLAFNK